MTAPRDWDKEMAEIDRLMAADSKSVAPAAANAPMPAMARSEAPQKRSAAPTPGAPVVRYRPVAVWALTLLGPLGAAGLAVWPYGNACGLPLAVYLVGVAAVAGASIWTMLTAWQVRRSAPMIVGMLTLLAALTLAALQVLPRVGYAAVTQSWICPT
jgi:hypothetical protein